MAIDVGALVDPAHTAIVTVECQANVVGAGAVLPMLADEVRTAGVIENVATLVRAARAAGVDVIHCTARGRADRKGSSTNARLFRAVAKAPGPVDERAFRVVDAIGVEDSDLLLSRLHGLSPMAGTDLDPVLRNLGCTTIVAVGVSLNIAVTNLAFDAVNRGYHVVVPRDAVVGVPREYGDAVLANTLSFVATITTTAALLDAW